MLDDGDVVNAAIEAGLGACDSCSMRAKRHRRRQYARAHRGPPHARLA
jgi:hypothetical protein